MVLSNKKKMTLLVGAIEYQPLVSYNGGVFKYCTSSHNIIVQDGLLCCNKFWFMCDWNLVFGILTTSGGNILVYQFIVVYLHWCIGKTVYVYKSITVIVVSGLTMQ